MDYSTCKSVIASVLPKTATEKVSLEKGLNRVTSSRLRARIPQPEFRQSMRDGYVIGSGSGPFTVNGLIQAGNTLQDTLTPGQASRIMTGAMVPFGGVKVLQQEDCSVIDDQLQISSLATENPNSYIQEKGSLTDIGDFILSSSTVLTSANLSQLASVGYQDIEVFRKPRVGYFCTGSELVDSPLQLQPGLKISSNRYLLDGLIRQAGAIPVYLGTVADKPSSLASLLQRIINEKLDAAISTGGMGPGKYDLVEKCFSQASGKIIYNYLKMIPGKNSLFGLLADIPFFGLPGPPAAVRALMNAIVSPALRLMQGIQENGPTTIQAHLRKPLNIKRPGMMQLRAGILHFENGRCIAEEVDAGQTSSCYLVISPEKERVTEEELIDVQLINSLLSYF